MRVALLAPISWRVPPRHYGPWERVVSILTEGLCEHGLDVTLFATADSITRARLSAVCPHPYSEDGTLDIKVMEGLHIAAVFERAAEFDLIHNHFDFLPLTYTRLVRTPVVTTIHGFSSDRIVPVYQKYNPNSYYVAISQADRRPDLQYIATIYHGIPLEEFTLGRNPGDYLLFFGRIHPEKGAVEAIEVARRCDLPLRIAGIIQDQDYFAQKIEPCVDGKHVEYLGPVGPDRRDELFRGARALLHLVNFDEPFGLSMIEAMACGTPVIAKRRGSIPEIVLHGETGFIVGSVEEGVSAVREASRLERSRIRKHVEDKFSASRMINNYIRVYQEILKRNAISSGH